MSKASDYANAPKPEAPSITFSGGVRAFVTDNGPGQAPGWMIAQGDVRVYVVPADILKLRDWLTDTYTP